MTPSRTSAPSIRLVCLPSADLAFADNVRELYASEQPALPSELEARLRRLYPRAQVRQRDLLGEPDHLWYVYRESPYAPALDHEWWRSPDTAMVAITVAGVAVEANEPLLDLLGVRREELIGSHYSRFVPPDAAFDAGRLLAIVLRRGEGASLVTLRRGDGTPIEVAWHAEVHGLRVRAWFQPV